MKKTTPAAAKKAAKKADKTAASAVPAASPPAKKAAARKSPAKKAAPKNPIIAAPATAAIASSSNGSKTTIVAHVDVGFGNSLYLRGSAPGLSWSTGVPMDCESDAAWSISIAGVSEPFEFKVLINDSYWSAGYNHSAKPGETVDIDPEF